MKRIAILGSTGSIGTQALQVAALHPDKFEITALCAHSNKEKLFEQVRTFRPKMAGLIMPLELSDIPADLQFCKWVFGADVLSVFAKDAPADAVLVSVVGIAGLKSVMEALAAGKQVLLANKEALVAGGHLVMEKARETGLPLLPVDSEHSAIFQCLQGAGPNKPEKILLTASGGPFRTFTKEQIENATLAEALNHPNWAMGQKITIDSATMFNKALEIIEAKWLFNLAPEQIEVVVHKESIVHSAVVFSDGGVIAQMGIPDMRLPILYAMAYPNRLETGAPPLDLFALAQLSFEKGDTVRFPALRLAKEALNAGGAACCQLNGANEEAVAAVLKAEMPFGRINSVVAETLNKMGTLKAHTLDDIFRADSMARQTAKAIIQGGTK
jgi:1-deoxy-D-xylulose 5-phosphate reductoisomerase